MKMLSVKQQEKHNPENKKKEKTDANFFFVQHHLETLTLNRMSPDAQKKEVCAWRL